MLLIAMHHNDSYLKKVESILRDNGINNLLHVKRDKLYLPFPGDRDVPGDKTSQAKAHFDKVIVATVTTKEFMGLYEALNKIELLSQNSKERGFICTLSYEKIFKMVEEERRQGYMQISKYLRAKFICTELTAETKDEAIEELANLIKSCPEINNFDLFIKDVFEREAALSTGIGHNVAIPHARSQAVDKLIVAFGISHKGIDFKAVDEKPVHLVFLIGVPHKKVDNYIKVLAYLTRLLKKQSLRKQLLGTKKPDEVIDIFKEIEK